MRRMFFAVAMVLAALTSNAFTSTAFAEDGDTPHHFNGGLGFHSVEAPIGVRWWFAGQKVGLDLGLGYGSRPASSDGYPDENLTNYALEVGVPFVFKSWDRVHVMFRPGLLYQSSDYTISDATPPPPEPFKTESATSMTIVGEFEAEVFLANNLSVSASHGIGFTSTDPGGIADSETTFGTFGNNFTNIGFHFYFFGGGQ
ncbi:MAG: hypothetical protein ABIS67_11365 [Candidatus Eisenbacteria bacterium]